MPADLCHGRGLGAGRGRVRVVTMAPRAPAAARRGGELAFYVLLAVVYAVFVVSTIPGVRPHPGYNLLLDGVLNNLAYMMSAVLCLMRARHGVAYRSAWQVLGVGLAVYGLGNIYWTAF